MPLRNSLTYSEYPSVRQIRPQSCSRSHSGVSTKSGKKQFGSAEEKRTRTRARQHQSRRGIRTGMYRKMRNSKSFQLVSISRPIPVATTTPSALQQRLLLVKYLVTEFVLPRHHNLRLIPSIHPSFLSTCPARWVAGGRKQDKSLSRYNTDDNCPTPTTRPPLDRQMLPCCWSCCW